MQRHENVDMLHKFTLTALLQNPATLAATIKTHDAVQMLTSYLSHTLF